MGGTQSVRSFDEAVNVELELDVTEVLGLKYYGPMIDIVYNKFCCGIVELVPCILEHILTWLAEEREITIFTDDDRRLFKNLEVTLLINTWFWHIYKGVSRGLRDFNADYYEFFVSRLDYRAFICSLRREDLIPHGIRGNLSIVQLNCAIEAATRVNHVTALIVLNWAKKNIQQILSF